MPREKRPLSSFEDLPEDMRVYYTDKFSGSLKERNIDDQAKSLLLTSELTRLLRQQEIIDSLLPGEELEPYPPGVTVHDVIEKGLVRQVFTGSIMRVSGR